MTRNKKSTAVGLTLTLLVSALAGCSGPAKATKAVDPSPGMSTLSGKVVETMDGGGYTYMSLEKDGKRTWAAVPTVKVAVGDEVKLQTGAEMSPFSSKALNRTFDKIIFSGGLDKGAASKVEASPAKSMKQDEAAGKAPEQAILSGKVVESINAGSYTYLRMEKDGKRAWAAVPSIVVAVGEEVDLIPGIDMGRFVSTSLKRTFENIHFSAGVKQKAGKVAAPPAAQPEAAPAPAPEAALPPGHPKLDPAAVKAASEAALADGTITGKVVETVNSGGYTYVCLEKNGGKTWAAIPATEVKIGSELSVLPGNEMTDFNSPSLKRSFEKIVFSPGLAGK